MRSVSSNSKTSINLQPSHLVASHSMIGYISPHSHHITSHHHPLTSHTHSYLFVCGNSSLLASLHSLTPSSSSHSLSLHYHPCMLLDHYDLKIDPLGIYTCIIILITPSSSPTPISLCIYYLDGARSNRIMDIGYISLISCLGIVGVKVATIL